MQGIKRWSFLTACLIVALFIQGSATIQVKTLKRIHDPVVMECKEFAPLFGSPMNRLALMARRGDSWAPIPFQIDQKKPDGSYAFAMGPGASNDPDPNLDANDELVFMVKDTGDRAGDGKWPEGAKKIMEIEIADPKNGLKGWLYLARFSGVAPRSKEDYIRVEIDEAKNYRRVISYEYEMGGPMDRIFPDLMRARRRPGGGGMGLDVLDRLKIRGEIFLVGGLKIPYKMDEMTIAKDVGYIDGPVRVLHFAQGYLEFVKPFKLKGEGHSIISYYVNHVIWPLKLDIPFSVVKVVKKVTTYGYLDFCPAVYGSYSFSAANPFNKNVIFDGRMSAIEKTLDTKTEIGWNAGFGPQGALVNRLIYIPKEGTKLFPYYLDDETVNDPPEDCPGVSRTGYKIVGTEGQAPGTVAWQYYYYLSMLKPKEVYLILDILDHPVKINVKAILSLN